MEDLGNNVERGDEYNNYLEHFFLFAKYLYLTKMGKT